MQRSSDPAGRAQPFEVPREHPEIARRLSLVLTGVASELHAGDELLTVGTITNESNDAVALTHTGWAQALIWKATDSIVAGGEVGWSGLVGQNVSLGPAEQLELNVRLVACVLNPQGTRNREPSPLPPGAYRIQAYCLLRLQADTATWKGWLLSPYSPIIVVGSPESNDCY